MKAELHKKILQEMKTLSQEQKQAMDQVLTERFLQHPFYQARPSQPVSPSLMNFKRRTD